MKGVPARRSFTRPFVKEKTILQREQKKGVAPALTTIAYGVVGAIVLMLILALGWALTRLGRSSRTPEEPARREPARSAVPAGA